MSRVSTPDGYGEVLREQSVHGKTAYLVKGAGFEGWYDALQVTADFADEPDDVIPNDDNETILPYPSRPQGPGWDGTTSTIQPDVDPHLETGGASDSLTGERTDEDSVKADIEGLFEPPSRLAGVRARRVHFAAADDPVLDVSALPEESPTGLENSPINPDGVSTDDLFDGDNDFGRTSSHDRLVIRDDLSFMRCAADEDQGEEPDGDSDDSSGNGRKGVAAISSALAITADLHFLANLCSCAEALPLHSKVEHREFLIEKNADFDAPSAGHSVDGVTPQAEERELDDIHERIFDQNQLFHPNSLDLVDHSQDDKDAAGAYNHYASVKKQADGYIGGSDGHYYLIASGGGKLPKGEHYGHYETYQDAHDAVEAIIARNHSRRSSRVVAGESGVHAPYRIERRNGRWHVVNAKGESKEKDGYATEDEARQHQKALYANVPGATEMAERKSSKTAAPAQPPQPTQIESQIEQLMQFWAVDNNGWWHWTGSQGDLALLNQMQQQMMAVGMPQGQPGAMQAQSKTAAPALLAALPEVAGAGAAAEGAGAAAAGAEGGVAAEGGGALKNMMGGGGGSSPAAAMGDLAQGVQGLFGSNGDAGVAHHGVPFRAYSFTLENNTPPRWREYLQTVASDRLVALAAWSDVVQKAKRLRVEGAITVEAFRPDVITAYVRGDEGTYYTTVQRLGSVAPGVGRQLTSTQVSGWSCECDWGHWAWLRKRSFVGRMCSHAYALFNEMRSLDARARRGKGKPLSAGKFASVMSRTSWSRTAEGGFEWCSDDPTLPTAAIVRHAGEWSAHVWPDGAAEDSYLVGAYDHSKSALRAVARVINAHVRLAESGDVDLVGGSTGDDDTSPYSDDGAPEPMIEEQDAYDEGPGPGIQESKTRTGSFSAFAEHDDGQDDEGPEETDEGIEEEDPDDEESLDEEIAEDESDDPGDDSEGDSGDDEGHDEPHRRDDSESDDEGTGNPGDESDDDGIEKQSVTSLQRAHGLDYLAGANYSLAEQDRLVREGEGKTARNRSDLNLAGTHYEAASGGSAESAEDTLAFLF